LNQTANREQTGTCLPQQGSLEQEVKFQDPFLENFRTFLSVSQAQDTENARFTVLINVIIIRTKASRHFYKHI